MDSIVNQTYRNIDIVLVNDGSTDNSGKICERYAKQDERIRLINQKNGGLSAARNTGLDLPDLGEFIMFVDSDDWLALDAVEKMHSHLKDTHSDCVRCGYQGVSDNGQVLCEKIVPEIMSFTGQEALRTHYCNKLLQANFVTAHMALYKREMFDGLRFKVGIIYEDIHLMPYLLLRCVKVTVVPMIGYFYFCRTDSLSRKPSYVKKRSDDSYLIWDEHLDLYQKEGLYDLVLCVKNLIIEKLISESVSFDYDKQTKKERKTRFNAHYKAVIKSKKTFKHKMRLRIYKYLGPNIYKKAIGILK